MVSFSVVSAVQATRPEKSRITAKTLKRRHGRKYSRNRLEGQGENDFLVGGGDCNFALYSCIICNYMIRFWHENKRELRNCRNRKAKEAQLSPPMGRTRAADIPLHGGGGRRTGAQGQALRHSLRDRRQAGDFQVREVERRGASSGKAHAGIQGIPVQGRA